jgi:hypothetical protein
MLGWEGMALGQQLGLVVAGTSYAGLAALEPPLLAVAAVLPHDRVGATVATGVDQLKTMARLCMHVEYEHACMDA